MRETNLMMINALLDAYDNTDQEHRVIMLYNEADVTWLKDVVHYCLNTEPLTIMVETEIAVILNLKHSEQILATWEIQDFKGNISTVGYNVRHKKNGFHYVYFEETNALLR